MITVGFKTDKGIQRMDNEDSIFVMPDRQIYMVADGVGGQSSGELASRMTVGYMAQFVALNPIEEAESEEDLRAYFDALYSGANNLVYQKSISEPGNAGMATTALLCYLTDDNAYFVNVGDSRAYLLRNGEMFQITDDHSFVQTMLREGLISEDEAAKRPDRNMITRAIGGSRAVNPDFFCMETYPGDTIILCTDGLYSEVDDDEIAGYASRMDSMYLLAKKLVDKANEHGGGDNISLVCIRIH